MASQPDGVTNGRQTMIRMASIASNVSALDPRKMDIPFMYIHKQFGYSVESIYRILLTQPTLDLGTFPDTFPNTISEYYWIQEGQPSVKPWIALGKLNSGTHFYYIASSNSDEDGVFFKNKKPSGMMHLWLSNSYSDIINWAMSGPDYEAYILATNPL
jgi:hypothetical protein